MRLRAKHWISCFATSRIPLDDGDPNGSLHACHHHTRCENGVNRNEDAERRRTEKSSKKTSKLDHITNNNNNKLRASSAKEGEGTSFRRRDDSPGQKRDDDDDDHNHHHKEEEDYIVFCFRKDGDFEVVEDSAGYITPEITTAAGCRKEEEEEEEDYGNGDETRESRSHSDGSSSSDSSFSFPALQWEEMMGSPVYMPKPQIRKHSTNCSRFRHCCTFSGKAVF